VTDATDPDEDAHLMLRLQGGEDVALNRLMERWQEPLTRFILRYTGNPTDAVDLAQEAFVRVYQHRSRYRPKGRFSTWLYAIATNLCRNHARWQRTHPTAPLEEGEGDTGSERAAADPSPAANAEASEIARLVREHIQKLSHDLKTVLLLFEYQDLSYEEIAGVLGCSPKAVETRLYRARKRLRQSLSTFGIFGATR
jgi:RNA polymerase sigma-70 factor (ECF subfamily)